MASNRVRFVPIKEWNEATDRATAGGDVAGDPRCLYGWGCAWHRFGHGCGRYLGHPGRCMEDVAPRAVCESAQRPATWDTIGRVQHG